MTEKNSKHIIYMTLNGYKLNVKDYKLFRKAKVSEISTFSQIRELGYMGFEHLQLNVNALIDKSRLNEALHMLSSYMNINSYTVVIDGISIGHFILTGYEICGSEDDYIYKVSLTLHGS